ncbi:MAG: conjugal transfer protein TraX [Firmicutes bacterium]|nr:conjugal transfer protein TraX [Bacillota bacterium]
MKDPIASIRNKGLSANGLKALACLFMFIDHWGMLICPQITALRHIGRLAFPIFAYMIGQGYMHTHDRFAYALRLALFAILYQYPYQICASSRDFNIFGELCLGLLAIALYEKCLSKNKLALAWAAVAGLALLGEAASFQYGFYGIALIFSGWYFAASFDKLCLAWLCLHLPFFLTAEAESVNQGLALLALPLLFLYNGSRGRGSKWWFYGFFCLHLPLLKLLALYVF